MTKEGPNTISCTSAGVWQYVRQSGNVIYTVRRWEVGTMNLESRPDVILDSKLFPLHWCFRLDERRYPPLRSVVLE